MKPSLKLSLLLVSAGTLFGSGAVAQTATDSLKTKWYLRNECWDVRLEQGALVTEKRAKSSKFSMSRECQNSPGGDKAEPEQESIPENIPLASIKAVVREEIVRKPVQEEVDRALYSLDPENLPSIIRWDAETGMFDLTAPMVLLAEAGALAPFRGIKKHLALVRIIWTEDGAEHSAGMMLTRKDGESLLERLSEATGKAWSEVRLDSAAPDKRSLELAVHFNKAVDMGDVTVFGGSYKFLIVTASDSTRMVYVFHENYRSLEDAIMVLTATPLPLGSGKPWKVNLVRTTEWSFCLSEIHTDTERLELFVCGKSRSLVSSYDSAP